MGHIIGMVVGAAIFFIATSFISSEVTFLGYGMMVVFGGAIGFLIFDRVLKKS